jgi:hypothetical protein
VFVTFIKKTRLTSNPRRGIINNRNGGSHEHLGHRQLQIICHSGKSPEGSEKAPDIRLSVFGCQEYPEPLDGDFPLF